MHQSFERLNFDVNSQAEVLEQVPHPQQKYDTDCQRHKNVVHGFRGWKVLQELA